MHGTRVDVQEADPPMGGAAGAQDIMRWVASQLPRRSRCNRVVFSDSRSVDVSFGERATLMRKESGHTTLDEMRSQWRLMTVFERFEQVVPSFCRR